MNVSDILLCYARHGFLEPLRKSAYRKFCRRNRGKSDVVSVKDGFLMQTVIGDSVDNTIYVYQTYEAATSRIIKTLAKQCDCFIDVGCNIGYYSCLYGTQNPGGRLICLDPNPEMIARTKENLNLNQLSNATLLPIAAGDHPCKMTLNIPRDRHSLSSLAYVPRRSSHVAMQEIEVDVKPLTDVIGQQSIRNALLKIDAEGFEYQVFRGLSEQSIQAVRYIIFELSAENLGRAQATIASLFSFSWMAGMDILRIPDEGDQLIVETAESLAANNTSANILLSRPGTLPKDWINPATSGSV